MMAESASAFEEFTESGQAAELTAPEDRYGPYGRAAVLAKDYLRALRLRSVICREIDEVMSPYDALLAPGRITVASPIDQPFHNPARGVLKDVIGGRGKQRRATGHFRAQWFQRQWAADRTANHGSGLRRKQDPVHSLRVSVLDRLAFAAPRPTWFPQPRSLLRIPRPSRPIAIADSYRSSSSQNGLHPFQLLPHQSHSIGRSGVSFPTAPFAWPRR